MAGPVKQSEYTVEPPDQSQEYTVEAPAATPPPAQNLPQSSIPKNYGFTPGNMLGNAWEGAKGLVGGAYEVGKDLVNNPNWVEGQDSTLNKFVKAPMDAQVAKAGDDLAAGNKMSAYGHVLAGSIPMIGPWAGSLGEQAGTGDVGGAVANAAGTVAGGAAMNAIPKIGSKVRGAITAPIDPNAAISDALHVQPKSAKMADTVRDVEGARPYLQGVKTQAELQNKIPQAKTEIWKPYQDAVNKLGNTPIQGPDGPTSAVNLEAERVRLSAERQKIQKMRPTDRQTQLQMEKEAADLEERYKAVTGALDPALQSTGIDPKAIRSTHGNVKGVERNVSGKSTVTEKSQPYGFRKMLPYSEMVAGKPSLHVLPKIGEALNDVRQGQFWSGKPSDVGVRRVFGNSADLQKPNFAVPPTQLPTVAPYGPKPNPAGMTTFGKPQGGTPQPFGKTPNAGGFVGLNPEIPQLQRFPGGGGSVYDSDVMGTINQDLDRRFGKREYAGPERRKQ